MSSNDIIAIPIETKTRELDGKIWLGLNAVNRGYNVILGPAYEVQRGLDVTRPDIYITKDPGDGKIEFFKTLRSSGITVCGLDPEGGVFNSIDDYMVNKTEFIDQIDALCAWGKMPANPVRQYYPDTNKIHVTGNPRFDLLQPRLRFIYKERAVPLNKQYNNYILLNGNFTLSNPYSNSVTELSEDIYGPTGMKKRSHANRIFYLFLESLYHLHSEFPETDIVIRPHPSEDNETYKSAFSKYERIHVKDTGDVRDWIAGASVVIHHDCTTGIESAMMGTPVVSYRPIQNEEYEARLPQIVSHKALSREELTDYVASNLGTSEPYEMDDKQTRELKQYFHNVDQSAAILICDVIDSLDTSNQHNYERLKPGLNESLKRRVKVSKWSDQAISIYDSVHKILGNESIPKQREYRRQKFPKLERNEIHDTIEQMKPLLHIDTISIEAVPLTNDTYYLRPQ